MTHIFFIIIAILFNIFLLSCFNYYSRFFNIYDKPDNIRKLHHKNIKVLGGTLISINIFLYSVFYLVFDRDYLINIHESQTNFLIFIVSALLMYIIGLIDDKKNLPALNKLIFTIIVVSVSLFLNKKIINEINLSFMSQSILLGQFAFLFTLFCYIIFINAFNMLDGINLQVGLYSLFIVLVMIYFGLDIIFSISIIFGLTVYIYFNYKNKVFLGDNGCLFLSYTFAYCFINLFNQNKIIYSDIILLILIIPGLEILRLSVERILNNKSILKADRGHIHHLVNFKNNWKIDILIIQFLLAAPFLISIIFKNNLLIIFIVVLIYFSLIFYFKKK